MEELESIEVNLHEGPFPHAIVDNFYNKEELELIWEELNYYTKPGKLLEVPDYGGVQGYTNAKAILLDTLYRDKTGRGGLNWRIMSNILTVNRKLFSSGVLDVYADVNDCCCLANQSNTDTTKVRYYHNGDKYDPHTDKGFQFLAFSYFYKEPRKFEGGQLYFPKYDYEIPCDNNSMIIFPGWVEHGVRKVTIKDSDYFDGYGRYAITSFFGFKPSSVDN